MRSIKFKAWDKRDMVMWLPDNYRAGYITKTTGNCECSKPFSDVLGDERYELLQFTSLLDKNGVEIYEGDILVYRDNMSIRNPGVPYDSLSRVCFGEYEFGVYENYEQGYGWYLKGITDDDGYGLNQHFANCHEVIGDIYSTPELLEEK